MMREVTLLRMSKLVGKLELSFSIGHMKVKSCLAKATRPQFYDVLNVHVEEGLLTVTEGDHGAQCDHLSLYEVLSHGKRIRNSEIHWPGFLQLVLQLLSCAVAAY